MTRRRLNGLAATVLGLLAACGTAEVTDDAPSRPQPQEIAAPSPTTFSSPAPEGVSRGASDSSSVPTADSSLHEVPSRPALGEPAKHIPERIWLDQEVSILREPKDTRFQAAAEVRERVSPEGQSYTSVVYAIGPGRATVMRLPGNLSTLVSDPRVERRSDGIYVLTIDPGVYESLFMAIEETVIQVALTEVPLDTGRQLLESLEIEIGS